MRHRPSRHTMFVILLIGMLMFGIHLTYAADEEPGPGDPTTPPPSETTPPPSETTPPPSETRPPPSETRPPPSETRPPPSETTPPPDDDGDGIPNAVDVCPTIYGIALYNGCPLPDDDRDGIPNSNDWCPTQAGIQTNNGCPAPTPAPVAQVSSARERGAAVIERVRTVARIASDTLNWVPAINISQQSPPLTPRFEIGVTQTMVRNDSYSPSLGFPSDAPSVIPVGRGYPIPYFEGRIGDYMETDNLALLITAFEGEEVISSLDPEDHYLDRLYFDLLVEFGPEITAEALGYYFLGSTRPLPVALRTSVVSAAIMGFAELSSEIVEIGIGVDVYSSPYERSVDAAESNVYESEALEDYVTHVQEVEWPAVLEAEETSELLQDALALYTAVNEDASISLAIFEWDGVYYAVMLDTSTGTSVTHSPLEINDYLATMLTEEAAMHIYRFIQPAPTAVTNEPTYTPTPNPRPTEVTPTPEITPVNAVPPVTNN